MIRRLMAGWVGVLATVGPVLALGPHELLVIANSRSSNSVAIAREFCRLREVPEPNLILLKVPESWGDRLEISPADFDRGIWQPVNKAARDRGIDDHILAWIYSCDFPTRIRATNVISLQGLTFLRGRLPDEAAVARGSFESPLFAGPASEGDGAHFPQSLDAYREWLGDEMPLPSMMLGYTGPRGNSPEAVRRCLQRGKAADGTMPTGVVVFATCDDVRSTTRAWQFPPAQAELGALGVEARIVKSPPWGLTDAIGLMMGQADVDMKVVPSFRPGAMAEHLTSWAADFEQPGQTKLTAWIEAGATASAGTVTEPQAIAAKFPAARFYVLYAAGATMLESFWQSIRCPLQILVVGEPLAQPWAPPTEAVLTGLPEGPISGMVRVQAEARGRIRQVFTRRVYLIDGKVIGTGDALELATRLLPNGRHRLRVVLYSTGLLRNQVFAEREIEIKN